MKNRVRQIKVTMYLDIPVIDCKGKYVNPNSLLEKIEDGVWYDLDATVNAPSEMIVGPIESDDLDQMISKAIYNNDNVVGFLTPDAKWYLTFCSKDKLAHINLANFIYPYYKDELDFYLKYDANFLDTALEKSGFVKVNGQDIRYFSNVGPNINKEQISQLIKYMKLQLDKNGLNKDSIYINDKWVDVNKISQMDDIAFNKLFNI